MLSINLRTPWLWFSKSFSDVSCVLNSLLKYLRINCASNAFALCEIQINCLKCFDDRVAKSTNSFTGFSRQTNSRTPHYQQHIIISSSCMHISQICWRKESGRAIVRSRLLDRLVLSRFEIIKHECYAWTCVRIRVITYIRCIRRSRCRRRSARPFSGIFHRDFVDVAKRCM